jgi:hypothetical protein
MKVERQQLKAVDGENGCLYLESPRVSQNRSQRVRNMATWDSHPSKDRG